VGVPLRRLEAREWIRAVERRVADVLDVCGVVDVHAHIAGIPIGGLQHLGAVDLLDHAVVEQDQVPQRALIDDLRELLDQVVLGYRLRIAWVGHVEDVDVVQLEVVDDEQVRLAAVLPHEDAV
jgi:hypothetical protein